MLPEDIVNPKIDSLSVITYVSQFPEAKLKEGAPLKETGDAAKVKAYGDGLKAEGLTTNDVDAEFFVDVSEAGNGPLKVEIVSPQELIIHPEVEFDENKKLFTYKYTPGEDGQYNIKISWCGKAIPNSPYLVNVVGSKRPRAATLGRTATIGSSISCKVYGPGVESNALTALAPAEFWVEEVPVGTRLQVKITGPRGVLGSNAFSIENIGKGKFSVVYRPPVAGKYKIEITAAGKEISSSPYTVTVGEGKALIGWARGPGVEGVNLDTGKSTWFKVFTPTASSRDVVVSIEGPKKSKITSTSVKIIDAIFKYTYTPKEEGVYKITILIGPKKTQQTLVYSVTVPSAPVKGPCKVWGPGLTPRGIQVNRPSLIFAQPVKRTEKKAVISMSITDPDGKKVAVTDEEGPDEVHTYTYHPSNVGCFTISASFENSPLPDFPVKVNVTDISKVKLSGPGVDGKPIPVNKASCILVDTTEAGPGCLECQLLNIESPNQKEAEKVASKMVPKVEDKSNGKTEIKFTPKLPCTASLAITFDDLPLPQSPLKLVATDKKPATVFGRGILDGNAAKAPTYFMVDVSKSGPGKPKVNVSGPKQTTVKVTDTGKEMFKCEYTPPVEGDYTAEVSFGGIPAENSPFKFKVLPKGSPQRFLVHGPAITSDLLVGSPAEFFLVKGDTPVNETAVMIQTPSEETTPITEPIDDKITKCTFTPREPGTYKIDVKADETPVPGSPFQTTAAFPEGVPKVVAMGEGLEKAYVDEWAQFTVDYSRAGPGSVGLSVDGPKQAQTKVEKSDSGKALAKYLPQKKGEYTINVTFDEQEIAGNPFIVQAIPREEETAVTKVVKLEAEGIKLGNDFTYKVDASATPKKRLSGRIIGPFKKESQLPQELITTSVTLKSLQKLQIGRQSFEPEVTSKESMYTIKFTPKEIGIYLLYVFVGDGLIHRMPYKIYVCDPTKVKITGCGLSGDSKSFDAGKPLNWQANCTRAGPGTLKAYTAGPDECSQKFDVSPVPQKEDCYSIEYIPDIPGSYRVLFAYSGYDLADKPVIMVGDSSKAQVKESDRKVCLVGEEVSFKVDLSAAGAGKLQASLEGPAEVPISFSKNGDGTCNFAFTPPEAGSYALSVSFGENLLTDKPLEVVAIAPERVEVTGPGVTGKGARVGEPAKVFIDCSEAGVAPVQATLTTPKEEISPLLLQPASEDESIFEAEYTPEEIGVYELDVKLADRPVKDSPFKAKIADPEKVKVCEKKPIYAKPGETVKLECYTNEAGPGTLTATLVNPNDKKQEPEEVSAQPLAGEEGHYEIPIKVSPGLQNAEVCYNDVPVCAAIPIVGGEKPECTVEGPGVKPKVALGRETYFTVDTSKAGKGDVSAVLHKPDEGVLPLCVTKPKDDLFDVRYKPEEVGEYVIDVAYQGIPLEDTPYTTTCIDTTSMALKPTGPKTVNVGEPVSMTTDLSQCPDGEFNVSLAGPTECPLTYEPNDDGKGGTFTFIPTEPGLYEANGVLDELPVSEEPLSVLVTDPDKVEVSGPGVTGKGASVGKPTEVVVDRTEAGPAPVEGVLSTPSGEKQPLDFQPKDESTPDILTASYTPEKPGDYQLDLTFNDEPIKDSPFTAKILDTDSIRFEGPGVESAAPGEENILDLFMPNIVAEEVTMEMMTQDHQEIPLDFLVEKVDEDHCQITFTPEVEAGICEATLSYAGAPLGDPIEIAVGNPSKCKVSGPGIEEDNKLPVGQETCFTVDSTEAGPGKPKVSITGPNDSTVEPSLTEEKPGVTKVTYTPEVGGPHEVSVLFGGHDVPGSPYSVPVCNPQGVKCAPVNPDNKKYRPGDEIIFTVDLKDAGEGDFSLGLMGPEDQPIVSEEAFIALVPVEESVDGNTETVQLKPEGLKPGSTFPYKINASGVQTGDVISGKVVGPFKNKKKIPKDLLSDKITLQSLPTLLSEDQKLLEPEVKEDNKIYDVNFTPDEVGVYALYVFLGDNLVNDMPTQITVTDADQVNVTGPGLGDEEGNTYPLKTPLLWEVDCTNAGPGKLAAYCAGPDDCSKKFKISPIPGKPDSYTIKYKTKKAGPYQVLFTYNGYEIPNKPTFSLSKTSFALLFGKIRDEGTDDTAKEPIEGDIHQTKNDDGTYTFEFKPEKPGLYQVAPSINDNPVFEEPLSILVTDPDKVEVSGPGVIGKGASVGKPTEVVVDRTEAGPAPVEGVLSTPSGEKQPLDFQPKDESTPDILTASYTPEKPGDYQLDLTFDDEPIKDSPFTAKILDTDSIRFEGLGVESAAPGEENILDLFMPNIVAEEVTMEMMTQDHQEIPLDFLVEKVDEDHCQITFTPEVEAGICEATLSYAGAPLGDPIEIAVGNPSKCKVSGPGIEEDNKLPVGQETCFTVDSTEAGPGKPKVSITGPNNSTVEPSLTEEKPGVTKVTYTPEVGGPHEVSVLFGGHDVPGSPYSVPVCNPQGVKCAPVNPDSKKYCPGDEIIFTVDLKDAGEGDFSLGLMGPEDKPIVSEEAFIALVPVEESVDGNTETVQLKPEGLKPGSTFPYKIDASGVQTGDVISGKVVGPFKNKKKIPKDLLSDKITLQSLPTLLSEDQKLLEPEVKEDNKIYDVNFTPEEVGVYALYVFLGDNLVNDMPTQITVTDADQVNVTGPGLGDEEGNTYPLKTPLLWEVDCTNAGPGKLAAYCAGPDDCSKKFKISPIPGKPDSYTVKYKTKKAGPYQVLFTYNGYELPSKPTFSLSKTSFALLFGKIRGEGTDDTAKEPIEGDIHQSKNDDGTYTFEFKPEKPGLYQVAPSINDNPVFEEPLSILVTDPDKVEVSGPGVTGKGASVGKPTEVVVDRTEAGPAPVKGVLSTPSGEKQPLDFQPKDESTPDILTASYTPEKPGDYQLDLTFDDEPIKDSPFTAKILDTDSIRFEGPGVESAAPGEENILDLFMPNIVAEEVTMEMMTQDHQEIPLDFLVEKVDEDHCQITFTPEVEAGICEATLLYAGVPLGDPIEIAVGNPSKCKVSGPGIEEDNKLQVGQETYFTVDSTEAGPGKPKVSITGPNDSTVEPSLTEEKPGVTKVTYTPEVGGPHEVSVLFGGHDVPGSPYSVPVCNPQGVKCAPVNPDSKKYRPGDEIIFTVDLKDAGEGDFSLGLMGPEDKPIVSEEAFIALVPVEESVDGNTEIVQLKPEGLKPGSTFPYKIDASGVQTGDVISGKVVGPFKNKKKAPKDLLSDKITLQSLPTLLSEDQKLLEPEVKEDNKIYDVNFTPDKVGVYVLYVFLGDNLVNDMPTQITVTDADQVKVTGPGLGDEEGNTYPLKTPLLWEVDCTNAGPGSLAAYCAGPDDCSKKFKISPIPGKPDSYTIKYKTKKAGPYQVLFTYNGYELPNKPTFSLSKTSFALLFGKIRGEGTDDTAKEPIEGDIHQTKNDDGTYTFEFKPEKPGLYQVAPSINDNPVFEEPLSILVTDPDKVEVSGPGVTGKGASVGKPTEVVVDRTEAGPAPVEGVLSTPSGEKQPLDFQPKDESTPDILTASYTPEKPGDYQLDLTFDDEPIKDSPFTAKILDTDSIRFEGLGVESAAPGEENILDLFMPNIVAEEVTMEMMTQDHQEIPLDFLVEKVDEDHCQITFTPEVEAGICEATLSYAGAPLGNPIEIAVGNPSKCKVSGPGIEEDNKLQVGQETYFTVDSTEAGPGKPKVTISGPNDSTVEPSLTEEKPGVTKVTYTPEVGGPHEVSVLFGGHDVPGSPYSVPVCNPQGVKCAPVNPDNKKYRPGDEIIFTVDLKDAGEGDFSLGLTGPEDKPIVSEEAFVALLPIEESIDGNTEIVELKPEGLKPGSTFPYKIDTSGVQTGDIISGKVVGPFKSKKKIPKDLLSDKITLKSLPTLVSEDQKLLEPEVKEENKIYDVNFTPEEIGVYVLYVFLGDNLVNDMPCQITVCNANEVKVTGPGLGDTDGESYPIGVPLIWEAYCSSAGPGKLTAYCAGPDDCSKKFKISPITGKENSFYIEYVPKKAGPYQLLFAYGDYEILQKPTFSATKKKYAALLGIKEQEVDDISAQEQPQKGKIGCNLNDDGTYNFTFKPEKPGLYNFLPTLCDQPVLEKPLSVLVTDPDKVEVTGPGVTGKGVRIGQPTDVIVDRRRSGPGPVEAVLSTPSGESQKIEFEPKEESEPDILVGQYTPQFAGYHSLSFTFDDQELPLSPLRVYVVNPEEFKLEGGGLKEATIGEVNIIKCFLEDTPEDGVFTMTTENEDGVVEPLDCETVKVDQDNCCIEFVPETETACFATLCFNEVPISDKMALTPNNIDGLKISGLKRCMGVLVNKERPFTADFRGCPVQEEMAISFIQADESQLQPTIMETEPGVYRIFFTPTVLGLLRIGISYGEKTMTYNVFVIDPSAVVCTGLNGESILVSEKLVFAIDTSAAGIGARLSLELKGEEQASLSCKHMINGHYAGVMSVVLAGVYDLHIFYGGYEIKGSPFKCKFHRPEPDASLCSISDLENNPGKIFVDCRQAGGCGLLEVAAFGAYVPARYIAVEHNGDYTFNVAYDIPDKVETVISVKWHGEHLKGSPFKVVFKNPKV